MGNGLALAYLNMMFAWIIICLLLCCKSASAGPGSRNAQMANRSGVVVVPSEAAALQAQVEAAVAEPVFSIILLLLLPGRGTEDAMRGDWHWTDLQTCLNGKTCLDRLLDLELPPHRSPGPHMSRFFGHARWWTSYMSPYNYSSARTINGLSSINHSTGGREQLRSPQTTYSSLNLRTSFIAGRCGC